MAATTDQSNSSAPPPPSRRRYGKLIFWAALALSLGVWTTIGRPTPKDAPATTVFIVRVLFQTAAFACLFLLGWTLFRLILGAYRRGYGMFILWTALVLPWGVLVIIGKNSETATFSIIMVNVFVRAALFASVLVTGWTMSRMICGESLRRALSFPTVNTKGKLGSLCVVAAMFVLPIHLAELLGSQAYGPGWPTGELDESIYLTHILGTPTDIHDRPEPLLNVNVGETVEIAGPTVEGGNFNLAEHRGKVVMVDFWATWCGPCKAELPHMEKAHEEFHNHGLEIVSVSLDNDRSALVSFLKDRPLPWTQVCGWQTPLAKHFGVKKIPTLLVVDKDGKLLTASAHGRRIRTVAAEALGLPSPSPWLDAAEECGNGLVGTVVAGFLFSPWWLVVACGLGAAVVGAIIEILVRKYSATFLHLVRLSSQKCERTN